ncbi:hypothetical protein SAMN04487912_104361 [Arthrobacter sp. cf158]|uniref:hypothetical protein n=1 Tax=Arthrobacter sp. cf158 TaxID=1761744 RepID=UPI00089809DC|nr:hypothetical protein [Arthrobacter sp. cf158]SDW76339.1 hypothetical protein SAMN04487912_104361 [Arthrobacter sp. cf158]
MSTKTRRSLLIFVFGFGTYASLMRPVGAIYALLIGLVVVAAVLYVERLVQSKRAQRSSLREIHDLGRR